MTAYGHARKDKQTCKAGCCTLKGNAWARGRPKVDRAAAKRARREGKADVGE